MMLMLALPAFGSLFSLLRGDDTPPLTQIPFRQINTSTRDGEKYLLNDNKINIIALL